MNMWYSIQIRPQLQLNVKNGSKRAKNEEKMPVICQKWLHSKYDTYECIFLNVYSFNIWVCDILYELGHNYKQMSKIDQKWPEMRKMPGICHKMMRCNVISWHISGTFSSFLALFDPFLTFGCNWGQIRIEYHTLIY